MKYCPNCTKDFPTGQLCPHDGAVLLHRSEGDPLLGRIIKQSYRIDAVLGSGGVGVVYRARQLSLDRDVAIKVLRVVHQNNDEAIQRFFREAKLASQLAHPNIVSVIDFGNTEDGLLYLVLEFLKGETLSDYVRSKGGLERHVIRRIMEQIVEGVNAAHSLSIVHRDLKPPNVLLAEIPGGGKRVKILDFGISKCLTNDEAFTQTQMVVGSPGYLSPEQIESSRDVDTRADIYALGGILYFLMSGRPPYGGDSWTAVLARQVTGPIDPIDAEDLADPEAIRFLPVVEKAMRADPEERYQTASEFLVALDDPPEFEIPPVRLKRPPLGARMPIKTTIILASCALLILVAVAGIAGSMSFERAPKQENRATARGVTADRILLGMSGPFSGPNRELGRAMELGIGIALKEVNGAGGVNGRRVELLSLDDAYEPAQALENARRLVEVEQVFAFIGNVGTPTAQQAIPYLQEQNAILFAPLTGARVTRNDPPDRNVFNLRASYDEEMSALIRYLVEIRGVDPKKIGVLTQDDLFGESGFDSLARALSSRGVKGAEIARVSYPRNTLAVEQAASAISERDVEAIVVVGTYAASAEFTIQVKKRKPDTVVANLSFVGSDLLREEFRERGASYGNGVIVTQVVPRVDSQATIAKRFRGALQQFAPNEQASSVALEGYVAAHLLIQGLRRAGPQLTTDRLAAVLESMRSIDLGLGEPLSFNVSKHQASSKVWGVMLRADGTYDPVELDKPA